MDEFELLLQRFVDNDLTPDERVRVLTALDQDAVLRRRLLEIELLVAEAGRLPRLAPSSRFLAQVRARVRESNATRWSRIADWLLTPRALHWRPAGALAAAVFALAVVIGVARVAIDRSAPPAMLQASTEPTVLVRLVLLEPQARSVAVAGDFNGWNPERTPLSRVDGGVWTATIPLKPGRYHYMYVVDGTQWVADPFAREESLDGFGSRNAVLDIEPPL
ncbi:MAG: isoamylase early set domain-containing protein [Nitrospirota bacterium]